MILWRIIFKIRHLDYYYQHITRGHTVLHSIVCVGRDNKDAFLTSGALLDMV